MFLKKCLLQRQSESGCMWGKNVKTMNEQVRLSNTNNQDQTTKRSIKRSTIYGTVF